MTHEPDQPWFPPKDVVEMPNVKKITFDGPDPKSHAIQAPLRLNRGARSASGTMTMPNGMTQDLQVFPPYTATMRVGHRTIVATVREREYSMPLGTAQGTITLDFRDAIQTLREMSDTFREVGKAFRQFGMTARPETPGQASTHLMAVRALEKRTAGMARRQARGRNRRQIGRR